MCATIDEDRMMVFGFPSKNDEMRLDSVLHFVGLCTKLDKLDVSGPTFFNNSTRHTTLHMFASFASSKVQVEQAAPCPIPLSPFVPAAQAPCMPARCGRFCVRVVTGRRLDGHDANVSALWKVPNCVCVSQLFLLVRKPFPTRTQAGGIYDS